MRWFDTPTDHTVWCFKESNIDTFWWGLLLFVGAELSEDKATVPDPSPTYMQASSCFTSQHFCLGNPFTMLTGE